MNITGNTILITGGGSGIGRGLPKRFTNWATRSSLSGRRQSVLDDVTAANPGMWAVMLDIDSPEGIRSFGKRVVDDIGALNILVNNAGIQITEKLTSQPDDLADVEAMVTTNLLGPIRLTAALLPLLRRQPQATIINITSGLAFVPLSEAPTYCATKAAMHSYTLSLRYALRGQIDLVEVVPPYVQINPRARPWRRSKSYASGRFHRRGDCHSAR
jgi:uncharacterized oxidoreductase